MSNYTKTHVPAGEPRVELHDTLKLTGAEISINNLPAGTVIPSITATSRMRRFIILFQGKGSWKSTMRK